MIKETKDLIERFRQVLKALLVLTKALLNSAGIIPLPKVGTSNLLRKMLEVLLAILCSLTIVFGAGKLSIPFIENSSVSLE